MHPGAQQPEARPRARALSIALAVSLLAACGGNPAATNPGAGAANLPPQQNPGVASPSTSPGADAGPKRDIKGVVRDLLSGEAIERATVFIEGVALNTSSTPIPATPVPGDEASGMPPEPGAGADFPPTSTGEGSQGLGARAPGRESFVARQDDGFQLAQFLPPGASPSPLPSGASSSPLPLGASPNPFASPTASPDAGASAALGATGAASPGPMASGTPGASQAAVPTSSPAASGAPSTPNPNATPYPISTLQPDSKGRFDLKAVPEGAYVVTVMAPGYQAISYQGNLPEELEIALRPLDPPADRVHKIQGVVRTADGRPAPDVDVELASRTGRYGGFHALTDEAGAFTATGVPPGAYALAAFSANTEGELSAFALLKEVPVAFGAERRTMSPSLSLRAVTMTNLFAGTLEGVLSEAAEKALLDAKKAVVGVKPVNIRAFISVADGEIPIASLPVARDAYFRMKLPALPEGASYHLVASGQDEKGAMVYAHQHDLAQSDPKLALTLPKAPGAFSITERSRGPAFAWEAVGSDVAAYRVAIEGVGAEGDTLWEGWTSGTSLRLPNLQAFNLLKEGSSYRVNLTAVRTAGTERVPLLAIATSAWASSASTKPFTFEVPRARALSGASSDTRPRPLVLPSTLRSPAGATALPPAAVRPSTKPSARTSPPPSGPAPKPTASTRYKPVTHL